MSGEGLFSIRDKWFVAGTGLTVGVAMLAAVAGLIVLPFAQPDLRLNGVWDAICSAAGVARASPPAAPPVQATFKTSQVVLASRTPTDPSAIAIGRGATLALQCAICHGPNGINRADVPSLAGQTAGVIYKELADFKSGARVNSAMAPFAAALSERDMLDLAAYYGYLPRVRGPGNPRALPEPRIVARGAPMRGIAPCASCHHAAGAKIGSPWLEGQPSTYLEAQLRAFASDGRHNDIGAQMRNIAGRMTPDEIVSSARHYADQP